MPFTLAPWGRAYLDSRALALAHALRVTRRDGAVFGFTNIRRPATLPAWNGPFVVPSQRYDSRYRLQVSNLEQSNRPEKADNMEVTIVAPDADFLEDCAHGMFFDAAFTLLFFDWRTDQPLMLRVRGTLGERKVSGQSVSFKMRSLANQLDGEILDSTSPYSRAAWGDAELGFFNLAGQTSDGLAARVSGPVGADNVYARRRFTLPGTKNFPLGRFVGGTVRFESGANAGLTAPVLDHDPASGLFTLDDATRYPIGAGDVVTAQIRPPLSLDEWILYFGTGFGFNGEPAIPSNQSSQEISRG